MNIEAKLDSILEGRSEYLCETAVGSTGIPQDVFETLRKPL